MRTFNYITQPHTFLHIIPRICSTMVVRSIANTKITPNHITILRALFNIAALIFFIAGDYLSLILAFCTFQINEILDHVDGDLARYKNMQSKKGLFLEYLVDVPGSTICGLFGLSVTIGIYRNTNDVSILFVFIACLTAFAINEIFAGAFSLRDAQNSFQPADYSRYIGLRESGSIRCAFTNIFHTFYMWRNQLILWSALLSWPVQKYLNFNPLFWSMVIIALLTQVSMFATIYKGYKSIYAK